MDIRLNKRRLLSRRGLALAALASLPAVVLLNVDGPAQAAGITPPNDPAYSIPANPDFLQSCPTVPASANASTSCTQNTLSAIDNARAAEGLGPISLPGNFSSLSSAQQLLDITGAERADRGLSTPIGLVGAYNQEAQLGAATGSDPVGPLGAAWGSNEAAGYATALMADYAWMYDDGPNSPNTLCVFAGAPECWAHRNNVLGSYGNTGLYMGAAQGQFLGSVTYTDILVGSAGAQPVTAAYSAASTNGCDQRLPAGSVIGMAVTADGGGYWIANAYGQVAACGDAPTVGELASQPSSPIVAVAATADGRGLWLVDNSGHVYNFGDAVYHGEITTALSKPIVAMAADAATGGYWLLGGDGGVFSFDAPFHGSTGNIRLTKPAVGMAATANGSGYYFVASDGGVFAYNAAFHGSMGASRLNRPVVGMALDPATGGYWLDAADGGIFSFAAPFKGSTGSQSLNAPCVSMAAVPNGSGYWFVARDGGIFSFNAPFKGSAA